MSGDLWMNKTVKKQLYENLVEMYWLDEKADNWRV